MKFLIIFFFLTTSTFANVDQVIENLVINKEPKKYDNLTFFDAKKKEFNLDDFRGNLILLNFWATWCAPCKSTCWIHCKQKKINNLIFFNKCWAR